MAIPFLAIIIGLILVVSVLFLTRSRIAAIIFSALDLVIGLTLIGSKAIPAFIFTAQVPEMAVLYLGAGMTIKGLFYLVLSFR